MRKRANPRVVKVHRSYTVDEVARLLGCHKNTVRKWLKRGLQTVDDRRPTLIRGVDLRTYIEAQRRKAKQPCAAGHIYCVACRTPKIPAAHMVDYLPTGPTLGNLRGLCPDCERFIHRRVSLTKLKEVAAGLEIAFPEGDPRIRDREPASVNSDFNG